MKRYKKREILGTTDVLIEAMGYITHSYNKASAEQMMDILRQCQEMAILLGNCLETFGESTESSVSILEDYCEEIYQISQNLSNKNICTKLTKKVNGRLAGLKSNIVKYIPDDKIEMVFFPYKASMWDSLESVWKAASEDTECEAYVVPIPYFERNEKGELSVMHYEGSQFPEDVPVIRYSDYSLAERRPDVAFIHNPYDQYNYVTSIHPAYYISELKKNIGKIAYIPYYVSEEPNLDSLKTQECKRGFVVQPGVLDSDLVFVQSEKMKKLYVNILEKEIGNVGREYWENKIFGFGSPKLDRVHSIKRNDDLLPPAWRSLIYDNNGNRKKVILYNISVSALLNKKDMMHKIADTLAFFKNQSDCVLWWRPHPLYAATLLSLRPNLAPVYSAMLKAYRAEGWGILDEGEDLEWAIAETDAYFGDGSSVVQLYKEAGKPILYQDTKVENAVDRKREFPVWPSAFCIDGDNILFVHGKINLLMKYNICTKETMILGTVPNEVVFQEMLYEGMYKYGNLIYLIPSMARAISVYDMEKQQFYRIELKEVEQYKDKALFKYIYAYGQYLYCIPYFYFAIIKLNMKNKSIEYIDLNHLKDMTEADCTLKSIPMDNQIFDTWKNSGKILVLDVKTDRIGLKELGKGKENYIKLCSFNNSLYLYDDNSQILWKKSHFSRLLQKVAKVPFRQFQIYKEKNSLALLSSDKTTKMIVDLQDQVFIEKCETVGDAELALAPSLSGVVLEHGNSSSEENNYCYDMNRRKWISYNNPGEVFACTVQDELVKEALGNFSLQKCAVENEIFNLREWSKLVDKEQPAEVMWENCGIKIKDKVKEICKQK